MSQGASRSSSVVSSAPRDMYARKENSKQRTGGKADKQSQKAKVAAGPALEPLGMITPSPRRTRGLQYAYFHDKAPRRVVPRALRPKSIPVTRLPGQDDIPPSDSDSDDESDTYPDTDPGTPTDEEMGSNDDGDSGSQASTVIEDDSFGFDDTASRPAGTSTRPQGLRRMGAIYGDEGFSREQVQTPDANSHSAAQYTTTFNATITTSPPNVPTCQGQSLSPPATLAPAAFSAFGTFESSSLAVPTFGTDTFEQRAFGTSATSTMLNNIANKLTELPLEEVQLLLNSAPGPGPADNMQFKHSGSEPGFQGTGDFGWMQAQSGWLPGAEAHFPSQVPDQPTTLASDTSPEISTFPLFLCPSPLSAASSPSHLASNSRAAADPQFSPQNHYTSTPHTPTNGAAFSSAASISQPESPCPPRRAPSSLGQSNSTRAHSVGPMTQPVRNSDSAADLSVGQDWMDIDPMPAPSSPGHSRPTHAHSISPVGNLNPAPVLPVGHDWMDIDQEPARSNDSAGLNKDGPWGGESSWDYGTPTGDESRWGEEDALGEADELSTSRDQASSSAHTSRTPTSRGLLVTPADIANSEGFIVDRSTSNLPTVQLIPGPTVNNPPPATNALRPPTLGELRSTKHHYYSNYRERLRVCKPKDDAPPLRSGDRAGNFERSVQVYLKYVEHSIYDAVVNCSPWGENRDTLVDNAIVHSDELLPLKGSDILDERARRSVLNRIPRLRGMPLDPIQADLKASYGITQLQQHALIQAAERLTSRDRFLYPNDDMRSDQFFDHPMVAQALTIIFFRVGRKIGIVFMERLIGDDKPDELATLISKIGPPQSAPTLADRTATKGVPIAAIAFAGVTIYHSLLRIQLNNQGLKFSEGQFSVKWASYVRELIEYQGLGALRMKLLQVLKDEYLRLYPTHSQATGEPAW